MAYETTAVPVEKSKEAIRKILIKAGVKGIQFAENFETHEINVRFVKDVEGNMRTVSVTLVVPEPPRPRRNRYSKSVAQEKRQEQSERSTYRALHYWLKSQFEAVDFGLLTFEDIFLSHFEWMLDGQRTTVGAIVKPRLSNGSNLLAPPKNSDVIDGEYR